MTMSKIFKNASEKALQGSQQTGGSIIPDREGNIDPNTPISQQKFAMDRSVESPVNPGIKPTFVPGIGVLGPDGGGAVQGTLLRQQYELRQANNQRQEEELGINKAQLANQQEYVKIAQQQLGINLNEAAMKTKTFEEEQQIHDGMVQAVQQGGYAKVIDYLKLNDPMKALVFQTAKLQLDSSIMQNDVMKAQLPNQLDQAMLDTYALGSRFATAIASAPQEIQAEMYKNSLPIYDKLVPGVMPREYNDDAKAFGQLFIAQGAPENIVYAQQSLNHYAHTKIGELNLAQQELINKGVPNTDPKYLQLQSQIDAESAKAAQAGIGIVNSQNQAYAKQKGIELSTDKLTQQYTAQLRADSKSFITQMDNLTDIQASSNQIKQLQQKGENASVALTNLSYKIAKANNGPGVLTEPDYQHSMAATGLNKISKNVESWLTGKAVTLQPWEVNQALDLSNRVANKWQEKQKNVEAVYQKSIQNSNNPQVWDSVVKPSQFYTGMTNTGQTSEQKELEGTLTQQQIDQMSQNAISKGADPAKVEQRKQQLYKDHGIITALGIEG